MSGVYPMCRVDCIPVKRRPRFAHGVAYTPKQTHDEEKAVAAAYTGELFSGIPVEVHIWIIGRAPKSWTDSRPQPYTVKPDADNVAKAVLDGLIGKAYDDDAQVTRLIVEKVSRLKTATEHVLFRVSPAYDMIVLHRRKVKKWS